SQPVGSLWFGFPVCEKLRHFPQVRLPSGSLRPAVFKFWLAGRRIYSGCLCRRFSDFRIGAPETGFEMCQRTVRKTTSAERRPRLDIAKLSVRQISTAARREP